MTDLHKAISGALFDFAGFLTTRPKPTPFGSCEDANAAVELLQEWAGTRGLQLDEADVMRWSEALAAPVVPEGWQPIETAPKGRVVLVHYKNELGNGRTMRARYYTHETLESDNTESGWADEGWYEESEAYEYLMALEHEPTHWMPLPASPKPKEQTT